MPTAVILILDVVLDTKDKEYVYLYFVNYSGNQIGLNWQKKICNWSKLK